jgi:hypothetical protein
VKQAEPQWTEMAGYLIVPHERVSGSYNAGFSTYVSAWPLLESYPGSDFQSGLFGTWMFPQFEGEGPKDHYTDIEGGLGWWRDTRFATETPKFIMLTCGKAKAKLPKQDVPMVSRFHSVFPTLDNQKSVPSEFTTLLSEAILPHHDKVRGCFVTGCSIISTDNSMLFRTDFDGQLDPFRLDYKYVTILKRYLIEKVQVNATWIVFSNSTLDIMIRSLTVIDYPVDAVKRIIDSYVNGEVYVESPYPKDLSVLVKSVDSFKDTDETECNMSFAENSIELSISTMKGEYVDEVEAEVEGEPMTISTPPSRLKMLLKGDISTIKIVNGYKERKGLVVLGENFIRIMGIVEEKK